MLFFAVVWEIGTLFYIPARPTALIDFVVISAINVLRCDAKKQLTFSPFPTNHPMALDAERGRRPPHQ
jgi:hypothetical protein